MRYLLAAAIVLSLAVQSPVQAQASFDTKAVLANIDSRAKQYADVAMKIWGFAEVGYQEQKSSALLQEQLKSAGFAVKSGVAEIPTAFTAEWGSGKPVIGIIGEFDALPGLSQAAEPERHALDAEGAGHGCGHHLFGTASTAAAIAVKEWLVSTKHAGTLRFYGTPAEEGGAGKVRLMDAGVFRDVDAAMMIHGRCGTQVWRPSLGIIKVKAEFHGKATHASSWPWRGVNALNAVIQLFVALDQMRQQLRTDARVHGIIVKGGDQPNIIPEYTRADFYLRALTKDYCQELLRRFTACADGAAAATGCRAEVTAESIIHDPLRPNPTMAELFEKNLGVIGFPVDADDGEAGYGSTDCGNVSQALPTIHPYIRISPDGVPGHSREFAQWARSPMARAGMVAGAKALALTALDLLASPDKLKAAKEDFAR